MFAKYLAHPNEAASIAWPITPADTPLARMARSLYVGTTGTLEVTLANDPVAPVYGASTVQTAWTVNITADTITIPCHRWATGQLVTAYAAAGGAVPGGLSSGSNYYVICVDANTIKLASSAANALAGTAIDLTAGASTFALLPTLVVSTSADTITIPSHGFSTADRVMVYAANAGSPALPGALAAQTAYFVIVVNANTIKLASSAANALAGTALSLVAGAGTGTLRVFKTTLITAAAVGYHSLCCQQLNAASTATNVVGLT